MKAIIVLSILGLVLLAAVIYAVLFVRRINEEIEFEQARHEAREFPDEADEVETGIGA